MVNVHALNKSILAFGALALFTILAGCSGGLSDIPSDAMAKEVVEGKNAEAIKTGMLQIESFEKTNGLKRVEAGVEQYVLEYKAVFHYPKGFMPECIDESRFNPTCFQVRLGYGIGPSPFKNPGARETVSGKIQFEKAERGWRAIRHTLNRGSEISSEPRSAGQPRRHSKHAGQATEGKQKPIHGDSAQTQTSTDEQTGILKTLDNWLEPLIYRPTVFSKRSDGLWLSDGSNEKQIIKSASPDDLRVFGITNGGQVLYRLGSKHYLISGPDAAPRQINLPIIGVTLPDEGHLAVLDTDKGAHLINMDDGSVAPIPNQPLPDRAKAYPESGMDMVTMQQHLADPENNRLSDKYFLWSANNESLAFVRCAGVCAIAKFNVKTRQVALLPTADGKYRIVDDFRGQPQLYPVLFHLDKLITSEYGVLREHHLDTGSTATLAQDVFAPTAAPDGKDIAYINSRQPRSVFIRDVPSGVTSKLTSFAAAKDHGFVGLSWSPDKHYLFYGIYYEDGTDGGWMMDMTTKARRRIPLDADKLEAKTMEVSQPFFADNFTKTMRVPRFGFISATGVRNTVIGLMVIVAALLVYLFVRLMRNVGARASSGKRMTTAIHTDAQQATTNEHVFCTECGARCVARVAFCPKCGTRF